MLPRDRMNATGNASANAGGANKGGAFSKPIVGGIIFILVLVGLYYLYNFLYGKNVAQDSVDILSGTKPMVVTNAGTTGPNAVAITDLAGVMDGGQYSVSFWIYVSSTKGFTNKLAHLMEISTKKRYGSTAADKGNTLVFIGLNPKTGSLIVRQNTGAEGEKLDNTLETNSYTFAQAGYPVQHLVDNYLTGIGDSTSSNNVAKYDDKCDILNGVEYQRWLLVTVVGNGRTLDVYIDGKLARSCVYKASFALGSTDNTGTAYFGVNNEGNLKGFFSAGKFYNYALTPDAVWALYQAGPGGGFSITDFFKGLFNVDISFSTTGQMEAGSGKATEPVRPS